MRRCPIKFDFLWWCSQSLMVMACRSRPHLVPILNKWSSKIHAATLQLGSKQAGSSKFLASTKGVPGIVDAIEAGLASKVSVVAFPSDVT